MANATAFRCAYCERSLPSKRGLRNHERAHHQAEVSARLASEEATSQSKSKSNRWSEEEIARFAEAAERWGINSNIQLAREVGTRTAKQCGNFKKRFLQAHPEMVLLGDALPTGSQLSPTSGSSADSDSPPPSVEAARLSRSPTHSPVSPTLGELILEAHAPPPKRMIEVWRKEPESPAHLRESSGHSVATAETPSPREVETPPPRETEATPTEKSGCVSQPISKSNNPLATESLEAEEWIQYPTTQVSGDSPTRHSRETMTTPTTPPQDPPPSPLEKIPEEEAPSPPISQLILIRGSPQKAIRPSVAIQKANKALRLLGRLQTLEDSQGATTTHPREGGGISTHTTPRLEEERGGYRKSY